MQKTETSGNDGSNSIGESWALVAESSWLTGQQFLIPDEGAVIGRGQNCDIIIPGNHLSRQHAQIQIRGRKAVIRDLGSANGTFINDKRISQCVVTPGDQIRLDVYSFRLTGPSQIAGETLIRPAINSGNASVQPAEQTSGTSRQWITKPTSPGNRTEPVRDNGSSIVMPVAIGLCLLMVATISYIFISRL